MRGITRITIPSLEKYRRHSDEREHHARGRQICGQEGQALTVRLHKQGGATKKTSKDSESLSVTFGGGLMVRLLITVLRGKTSLCPQVTIDIWVGES